METAPTTRTFAPDELKGGDLIVLPFRIPPTTCGPAIPRGTVVEVFDTIPRDGLTTVRVITPSGSGVRTVAVSNFTRFSLAD